MMSRHTMHLDFDSLSDLIDGELGSAEAEANARAHLVTCPECAQAFDALTDVVATVGSLQVEARPARDLWSGIEARIAPDAGKVIPMPGQPSADGVGRRTVAIPVHLAWAAGIALALLSGTTAWLAIEGPGSFDNGPLLVGNEADGGISFASAGSTEDGYDLAIEDLEQVLTLARQQLEPETVSTLEASLAEIGEALREAEEALLSDPGNAVIYRLIAAHERTRYRLLSRTASLLPRS